MLDVHIRKSFVLPLLAAGLVLGACADSDDRTDRVADADEVIAAGDLDGVRFADDSTIEIEVEGDERGLFDRIGDAFRREPEVVVREVPAGTTLAVRFEDGISSNSSTVGQAVRAHVIEPVVVDGSTVIPAGAFLVGEVTQAHPPKIGGRAQLAVAFYSLALADGESVPIEAGMAWSGKSEKGKDTATIAGSTIGGAILGHQIDGDDEGKVGGGLIGAAAGTAIAHKTKGQPVAVAAGTEMRLALDSPTRVEVRS